MVDVKPTGDLHPGPRTLSSRELEVLGMTARGRTNAQIAAQLGITTHAVKFHLSSIYRKLGVTNRTEAAVAFLGGTVSMSGEVA